MEQFLINKIYDSLCELTSYPISLIDENGKVRASKSAGHIGAFHETAYMLLKSGRDLITINTDDPESGVCEGVYMVYFTGTHRSGVIGVYGPIKEVLPITTILKHSLEVSLEFELYKRSNMGKFSAKERLLKVLYSVDYDPADLEQALHDTSIDRNVPRIPLLFEFEQSLNQASKMLELLEASPRTSKQDLMGLTNDGSIFLLKALPAEETNVMWDYKYYLGEYMSFALRHASSNSLEYRIYVGPVQSDILHYHQGYLYCRWMQSAFRKPGSYYFYDCIVKYLESIVPQIEYKAMFSYLKETLGQKFIENYVETMAALVEKDYNLIQASSLLHVHKNTLIYRLDKIRSTLNMNPLTSNSEREFMECFYYYLTH